MLRQALDPTKTTATPGGITDLRGFLAAEWRLRRTIDDRRLDQRGRLAGRAVFAPDGADLLYREEGRLRLGDVEAVVTRIYRYAFPAPQLAPQLAEVRFADGRPFHRLDLSQGAWRAEHRCGEDLYRGSFSVTDAGGLTVAWRVTGPCKDLWLESVYLRPS